MNKEKGLLLNVEEKKHFGKNGEIQSKERWEIHGEFTEKGG